MLQRAPFTLLTILLVVACAGPALRPAPDQVLPADLSRLSAAERAQAEADLEPFWPAFESLEAALAARDDVLARRILTRIQARDPKRLALERAQAFERILEGREWTRSLRMWLSVERLEGSETWVVRANASHDHAAAFSLRGAPPTLRTSLLGISPNGVEQRFVQQTHVDALAKWQLAPGTQTSLEIARMEIPPGAALAVRAQFSLEFLPGDVELEGRVRPVSQFPLARGEGVRLASYLPPEPVDPSELVRYVRDEMLRMAPLLERSVRIPLNERARALDLLTPVALEMPSVELEKLAVALRWLSGQTELGGDAHGWRQWLDARLRARSTPPDGAQGELALPDAPAYRQ